MEKVVIVYTYHEIEDKKEYIKSHGIKLKKDSSIKVPLDFFEEHKNILMTGKDSYIRVIAEFSKKEVLEANYALFWRIRECGFPMPDSNYEYEKNVFDKSLCPNCKSNKNQINPFRLSKIPSLKKNKFFSATWESDTIFVEKEYYTKRLEPLGIGNLEVINHKKDTPFDEIVQLEIPRLKYPIDIEKYLEETCEVCGTKKYHSIIDDFIPPFKEEVTLPIVRSAETYGINWVSYNKVYVNNELKNILLEDKQIKWDDLVPVRNKDAR